MATIESRRAPAAQVRTARARGGMGALVHDAGVANDIADRAFVVGEPRSGLPPSRLSPSPWVVIGERRGHLARDPSALGIGIGVRVVRM